MITVPLNNSERVVQVDDQYYDLVKGHTWHEVTDKSGRIFYARSSVWGEGRSKCGQRRRRPIMMHRIIMGAKSGEMVDHRDGDGLNNRRYNMRIAEPSGNSMNRTRLSVRNTSGFTGVSWWEVKGKKMWAARITVRGQQIIIGSFLDRLEAAEARRAAEVMLFGVYAPPQNAGITGKYVGQFSTMCDLRARLVPQKYRGEGGQFRRGTT